MVNAVVESFPAQGLNREQLFIEPSPDLHQKTTMPETELGLNNQKLAYIFSWIMAKTEHS
jgi:hypothetical protein